MEPLKITAYLMDGRVATTDSYLPLDSILAAEWMRRNHPDAYYNASSHMLTNELIIPELPFERRGHGNDWYWSCSFNQEEKLHEYITHWHKRFDDNLEQYIDFRGRRGKINTQSAKYKAYRTPLVIQLYDRLTWYAVGDMAAVFDLCRTVTHIGKKSSQGYGAVDYWEIEPWPEPWSVWVNGRLMRAIPTSEALPSGHQEVRLSQWGIRPPYWHRENQRVCYVP